MNKKYSIFILLFALVGFISCNKQKDRVEATIINTGDITYAGCGYVLQLQDKALLKPTYLPSAFQHDGFKVSVNYHHTGIADTCDYGPKIYDLIKIDEIEMIR